MKSRHWITEFIRNVSECDIRYPIVVILYDVGEAEISDPRDSQRMLNKQKTCSTNRLL